jgi:hypothetical protein
MENDTGLSMAHIDARQFPFCDSANIQCSQ